MPKNNTIEFNHYTHSAPTYTETILWHRVIGVLASILVLMGGIIWLGMSLLSPTPEEKLNNRFDVASLPATRSIPESGPDESPTIEQQTNTAPPPSISESSPSAENTIALASPGYTSLKASPSPAVIAEKVSEDPGIVEAPSADYKVFTKILSKDIQDAALTQQMEGLEPANVLNNTEALNDDFIKLYFYTDLNGRKGDVLTYTWIRNDKTQAKVRIGVWSDRWRSHASKNINKNMRGDWKVIVTDQKGNTLATSQFTLKPLNNG